MVKKRNLNDGTTETVSVEEGAAVVEAVDNQNDDQATDSVDEQTENANEENPEYETLLIALQDIRKNENIVGYILKSNTKATVDLKDSTKIVDYALLTSQTFASSRTLSDSFDLDTVQKILVKGKNLKVLCIDFGQNKLGIFMEKNADPADISEIFAAKPTKEE